MTLDAIALRGTIENVHSLPSREVLPDLRTYSYDCLHLSQTISVQSPVLEHKITVANAQLDLSQSLDPKLVYFEESLYPYFSSLSKIYSIADETIREAIFTNLGKLAVIQAKSGEYAKVQNTIHLLQSHTFLDKDQIFQVYRDIAKVRAEQNTTGIPFLVAGLNLLEGIDGNRIINRDETGMQHCLFVESFYNLGSDRTELLEQTIARILKSFPNDRELLAPLAITSAKCGRDDLITPLLQRINGGQIKPSRFRGIKALTVKTVSDVTEALVTRKDINLDYLDQCIDLLERFPSSNNLALFRIYSLLAQRTDMDSQFRNLYLTKSFGLIDKLHSRFDKSRGLSYLTNSLFINDCEYSAPYKKALEIADKLPITSSNHPIPERIRAYGTLSDTATLIGDHYTFDNIYAKVIEVLPDIKTVDSNEIKIILLTEAAKGFHAFKLSGVDSSTNIT